VTDHYRDDQPVQGLAAFDREGYSERVGDYTFDAEADRALRITEAAEAAVEVVKLGYAADFPSSEDAKDFWAMVRELLPNP
jgi:hypothetical protein